MAIASCNVNIIGRSGGRCSVAAAAYRAGEKLHDERTGKTYDYSRKRNIAYTEILTPAHAPAWAKDRSQLWNAVEKVEKRCDAQTAREIRIALPVELTLQQNIDALRDYAKTFVKQGMIVDFALHNEKGNPHAHMMLTTRSIDENGFGQKVREWNKPEKVEAWRKSYEHVTNHHLEQAGCPERIDVRSYARQGIEKIPTIHLGHSSHEKEQRGEQTIRGDRNREIEARNSQIEQANKDIALVKQAMRQEQEAAQREAAKQREVDRQRAAKREHGDTKIISETEMHKHIQQEAERQHQRKAERQLIEAARQEAQRQAAAKREQQRQQEAERQRQRRQQEADRRAAQKQEMKRQQQKRETAPRTVSETDMQKQFERLIEQARKELQRQENQPQKPSIWEVIQKEVAEREAVWKRQEQEREAADRQRAAEQEKEQAQKMEVLKRKQEADRRATQQQPPPSEYMKNWQRRVQEHRENQPTTEPEQEPEHHDRPQQSEFMRKWQEQVREYRHHKPERHIQRKHDHDRGR